MRPFLVLAFLFAPLCGIAADDQVVKAMSKATGFTEAEIRKHGEKGCESGVQLQMTICTLYKHYEKDVALNVTYQRLIRKLEKQTSREELRAAQRAWVTFRDAQCRFETAAWEGGSARAMINAACLSVMTVERTKQLQETLECEGEDCPEFKKEER